MNYEKHTNYTDFTSDLLNPSIRDGDFSRKILYLHSKLISETGELLGEICKKDFHQKEVPIEKIEEEMGDIQFYLYSLLRCCENELDLYDDILEISNRQIRIPKEISIYEYFMQTMEILLDIRDHDNIDSENLLAGFDVIRTLMDMLELDYESCIDTNLIKLRERHPSGYNAEFYTGSVT